MDKLLSMRLCLNVYFNWYMCFQDCFNQEILDAVNDGSKYDELMRHECSHFVCLIFMDVTRLLAFSFVQNVEIMPYS
jgi:hypothetical protein